MSESEAEDDGVAGRREVAHRLFAAEFDDADFSYSESDEERAPNYVVTPTGARVNRLFVVGVLTEIESVNDEVLRARVVDPTGPFVVYAGQYQPDELAFLEAAEPPLFVAVTGKARTFQPDDSDRVYTSVRPESISQVDADTRDRWVVQAAEQTIDRVGRMASAKQTGLSGDELRAALAEEGVAESLAAGIPLALEHYGTTGDYLDAVREMSLDAARVVAGEIDEASPISLAPGDGGDDPIPVLASLDIDADVGTPDTSADEGTVPSAEESLTTDVSEDRAAAGTADESETPGAEATVDDEAVDTSPDEGDEADQVETESVPTTDADPVTEDAEPEPAAETSDSESVEAIAETAEPASTESEQTTAPESDAETESDALVETADTGESTDTDDGDIGDFDPEFELDEEEREEIESEYGTDFQSGTEVGDAGEAGIETPDPEEMDAVAEADETEAEPGAAASDAEAESESESEAEPEPADDVDLEDAVMDVMAELDDGGGADREEIQAAVVDRYGADPGAVDDAIQDALMGGRCYEPEDGKLTPI